MRSDSIIPKIKDKAIQLLKTTTLNCTEIGNQYCNKDCYTAWQKSDVNKGKNNHKCKMCGCGGNYIHII